MVWFQLSSCSGHVWAALFRSSLWAGTVSAPHTGNPDRVSAPSTDTVHAVHTQTLWQIGLDGGGQVPLGAGRSSGTQVPHLATGPRDKRANELSVLGLSSISLQAAILSTAQSAVRCTYYFWGTSCGEKWMLMSCSNLSPYMYRLDRPAPSLFLLCLEQVSKQSKLECYAVSRRINTRTGGGQKMPSPPVFRG